MPRTWIIGPFRDYADRVAGSCRFGLDQDTKDFIGEVSATAERNVLQIEPGHKFWRAQLGHDNIVGVPGADGAWAYDSIRPHTPERMTPSSRFVKNGRANPVGIAYAGYTAALSCPPDRGEHGRREQWHLQEWG